MQSATFSVTATSSDQIYYQWWRVPYVSHAESKITDIPDKIEGATTDTLSGLINDFDYKPDTEIETGVQKFISWYKAFYSVEKD